MNTKDRLLSALLGSIIVGAQPALACKDLVTRGADFSDDCIHNGSFFWPDCQNTTGSIIYSYQVCQSGYQYEICDNQSNTIGYEFNCVYMPSTNQCVRGAQTPITEYTATYNLELCS